MSRQSNHNWQTSFSQNMYTTSAAYYPATSIALPGPDLPYNNTWSDPILWEAGQVNGSRPFQLEVRLLRAASYLATIKHTTNKRDPYSSKFQIFEQTQELEIELDTEAIDKAKEIYLQMTEYLEALKERTSANASNHSDQR